LPILVGLMVYAMCGFWVALRGERGRAQNCTDAVMAAVAMLNAEDAVFAALSQCGLQCGEQQRVQGLVQDAKQARKTFTTVAVRCLE
jgi:hypothetical protein